MEIWVQEVLWGLGGAIFMYCAGIVWDSDRALRGERTGQLRWLGMLIAGLLVYMLAVLGRVFR